MDPTRWYTGSKEVFLSCYEIGLASGVDPDTTPRFTRIPYLPRLDLAVAFQACNFRGVSKSLMSGSTSNPPTRSRHCLQNSSRRSRRSSLRLR